MDSACASSAFATARASKRPAAIASPSPPHASHQVVGYRLPQLLCHTYDYALARRLGPTFAVLCRSVGTCVEGDAEACDWLGCSVYGQGEADR